MSSDTLGLSIDSSTSRTKDNDNDYNNKLSASISSLHLQNKEKISFMTFYYYSSKFEIQMAELESLLFWTSLSEIFFFTLGSIIFFAHPATLDSLWIFIVHLFRAINGIIFLLILPRTFQAIEVVRYHSDMSVEELEKQMKTMYKGFFSHKKSNIRVIFVVYFILTMICSSVNDYAFFDIVHTLCVGRFKLKNLLTIAFVIVYYFCNGVYFSWFSTLWSTMPTFAKYLIWVVFQEIKMLFGLFRRWRKKKRNKVEANSSFVNSDNTITAGNVVVV